MRTTRWMYTMAALGAMTLPTLASAQANCNAAPTLEPGTRPTCNITRDVKTSIASVLRLKLVSNTAIQLIPSSAADTTAYEMTRVATDASQYISPAAADRDSVIVQANRPYTLTMGATTDAFLFEQDANYNVCRVTVAASTTCASYSGPNLAKPVTDLYFAKGSSTTYTAVPKASGIAATIHSMTSGERYATGIAFTSAWYYGTDIPGAYTATIRYTLTGQ